MILRAGKLLADLGLLAAAAIATTVAADDPGGFGGVAGCAMTALLVMTMTIGYIAVDRWSATRAQHAFDCAGPTGLSASQTSSQRS